MKPDQSDRREATEPPGGETSLAERQSSLADRMERLVAASQTEWAQLLGELEQSEGKPSGRERELSLLSQEMLGVVEGHRRLAREILLLEQQRSDLASLYVASAQLHCDLEREQVLATIQEVVVGMIGCQEMAVFEVSRKHLTPVSWFGIDERRYLKIPLGVGRIGRTAATGEPFLRNGRAPEGVTAEEDTLSACVPLKARAGVIGVIALFRLPPPKRVLEARDHELLGILSRQAASALSCAESREKVVSDATKDNPGPDGSDPDREEVTTVPGSRPMGEVTAEAAAGPLDEGSHN
jgi:hypothetical protein